MDAAGLTILLAELEVDCSVVADAGRKAGLRLRNPSPGHLEACAWKASAPPLSRPDKPTRSANSKASATSSVTPMT